MLLQNNLLKIVFITFIIVSILFSSFIVNVEAADAIVIDGSIITIIGAILIGAGMIFNNDDDLSAAASNFYNFLDAADAAYIADKAGELSQIAGGNYAFKATQGILTSLGNWLSSKPWEFDDAGLGTSTIPGATEAIFQGIDFSSIYKFDYNRDEYDSLYRELGSYTAADKNYFYPSDYITSDMLNRTFLLRPNKNTYGFGEFRCVDGAFYFYLYSTHSPDNLPPDAVPLVYTIDFLGMYLKSDSGNYVLKIISNSTGVYTVPLEYSGATGSVTTFPNTNVKSDPTFFPHEFVSSSAGTTEFPSNTASDALTTETPLTIPETGVNSTTGATDVRAPGATVPDIPAEASFWEKLWIWLQNIIDGIVAIPSAIAGFLVDIFVPDFSPVEPVIAQYSDKFIWVGQIYNFIKNIFDNLMCDEPPKIPIYLNKTEGSYNLGGKEYILDMTWYSKYKPSVDTILSGLIWAFFLWRLFKRIPDIISGAGVVTERVSSIRDKG